MNWDTFIKTSLPTRKHERFKYADFSFLTKQTFEPATRIDPEILLDAINHHRLRRGESILLVTVNGYFIPALSDIHKLPRGVITQSINELMPIDAKKYPFASLNSASRTDSVFFHFPDHCELSMPIHLLSLAVSEATFAAHPAYFFVLGEKSKLTVIEEYFSYLDQAHLLNTMTTFILNRQAELTHYKIQQEGKQAIHLAHTFVQQKQDSQASFTSFSFGSAFARDEIAVTLQEPGASCRTAGFYHADRDQQYIDHHVDIVHAAPNSQSDMLYKGLVENRSRAVFNGKLQVEKGAQKILAHQANHNLLLSPDAEVYSKPELEIYADDVKCKHGATTGQLDQEALFYLRSRGIEEAEARAILLAGFSEEIMQRITHPGIKLRVQEMVQWQ
ncbi:MAG: Fe-S cluster assembly protein SufD [Gammaproteobacteria bacterium]|nr:MAG: Fe-S cluster assembly protein SufD [Gammaproteobacteria bacterium]